MITMRRVLLLLLFSCFAAFGGALLSHAQSWEGPDNSPPTNNESQPSLGDSFAGYVRRSTTTDQAVSGPLVLMGGSKNEVRLGAAEGSRETAGIVGVNGAAFDAQYLDGHTGLYVYGAGVSHSVVGYAESDHAESYGVVGRGLGSALAARFYGPVKAVAGAVSGDISVAGGVTASAGISCDGAALCTPLESAAAWLSAVHATAGTAVYAIGAANPGVRAVGTDPAAQTGFGLTGVSTSGYGATGLGAVGIYGRLVSSNDVAIHYGVAGIETNAAPGSFSRVGVLGASQGGFGSFNYGDNNTPKYDIASGVRACVKDAAGAINASRGVYAHGGAYSGYFDAEYGANILVVSVCTDDSFKQCTRSQNCKKGSCVGVLKIGDVYLTKTNLRGLLCKAAGANNPASCVL